MGACTPSNRIDFDEDEANLRCRLFHSPTLRCTSGVHVHYSAPHDIVFMSQVSPGTSAEVFATSRHRPTYGTQEGLASNGAAVAALASAPV